MRRFLAVILVCLFTSPSWALVAYDSFDRTNESPMTGGGTWATSFGAGCNLTSNAVIDGNASDSGCRWVRDTFSPNQFSQATIAIATVQDNHGLAVRQTITAGVKSYYFCDYGAIHQIGRFSNTVLTVLKAVTVTINSGDVGRCEISGNISPEIRYYKNGVLIDRVTDVTASALGTGQPGLFLSTTDGTFDNWSGGDLDIPCSPIHLMGIGCGQ